MDPPEQSQALLFSREVARIFAAGRFQKLLLKLGQAKLLDVNPGFLAILNLNPFRLHLCCQRPVVGGEGGDRFRGSPPKGLVKLVPQPSLPTLP